MVSFSNMSGKEKTQREVHLKLLDFGYLVTTEMCPPDGRWVKKELAFVDRDEAIEHIEKFMEGSDE